MSVINQMLKDLEARQRSGAAPGPVQSAIAGTSRRAGGTDPLRLAIAIGLLVVLAGGIGWYVASRAVGAAPQPASPVPATAGQATAPSSSAVPAPVTDRPLADAPVDEAAPTSMPAPAPATHDAPVAPPGPSAERLPPATEPPAPAVADAAAPPARHAIDRLPPPGDPLEDVRGLLADGEATEALARLDAAPSGLPESRALRATALQALGRHREAIDEWTAALERQADVAAWWVGLAISLEADGRAPEALAAYAQAGRHGPLEPALADYVRGRVDALSATTPR